MTCIKTGARCYLREWKCVIIADLHVVGDAIVINGRPEMLKNAEYGLATPATHDVYVGSKGYMNNITGYIVVPSSQVLEEI